MSRFYLALGALAAVACATARPTPPVSPTSPPAAPEAAVGRFHGGQGGLPRGKIIDAKTGAEVSYEALIAALSSADQVYVGEVHDERVHHEAQLWVLKGLFYARPGEVAVGMEMFQRPYQGVLDLYLSGEIGEKALIRESQYEKRWGYDFALYRPILRFSLDHQVPIIALNAPTEWVRQISSGGLEALPADERAKLPELDLKNAEHRRRVEAAYKAHPHKGDFERFYLIQTLWDETMADSVAIFYKSAVPTGVKPQIVVFAGRGHVEGGVGIPERVKRRLSGTYKIVMPISVPAGEAPDVKALQQENLGDYLWLLEAEPAERKSPHGSPHRS